MLMSIVMHILSFGIGTRYFANGFLWRVNLGEWRRLGVSVSENVGVYVDIV